MNFENSWKPTIKASSGPVLGEGPFPSSSHGGKTEGGAHGALLSHSVQVCKGWHKHGSINRIRNDEQLYITAFHF